ncbi:MAG: hypothetical protein J6T29_04435 [Alphaproteobacteria bacterium]|nr:hypothetical protein [Alphaproteobacteria bacterium]
MKLKGNKVRVLGCLTVAVVIFSLLFFLGEEKSLYDQAFSMLMKNEGGYVNNPYDPGGETKYGICKKYNPNIDIKSITLDFAKQYYYQKFWHTMYEKIKDQKIALKLFDTSVNIGKEQLYYLINETLLDAVCYPDEDAIEELEFVTQTSEESENFELWNDYVVEKINTMDSDLFLNVFKSKLIQYYCSRVYDNNDLHIFRLGWIKRAAR